MANVFLSYARQDETRAKAIALALQKVGHSVWWDQHIGGGTRYAGEIEEALNNAAAVLVLWSESSIRSDWVRDEASAGRASGKLVPFDVFRRPVDPGLEE